MSKIEGITVEQLKEELRYEPDTGEFFWIKPKKKRNLNKPIGTWRIHGSNAIGLNGITYCLDDLAVFYMTGKSHEYIGFKDFNPKNLKWENIELLDLQEYNRRRKAQVPNVNGIRGIMKNHATNKWYTQVLDETTKRVMVLTYDTPIEAMIAWEQSMDKRFNG